MLGVELKVTKVKRTTEDILRDVQETLKTTELGLHDLKNGPPPRKLPGLRNLIVFGRAVTNILQGLRATEPDFDHWYKRYVEEMESDELMRYFYKLRSQILKEGVLDVAVQAYVKRLTPAIIASLPRPPFARSFFIGDQLGGSGWEIKLPDGSTEKYYLELPSDIGTVSLHFPNPPMHHLSREIGDNSLEKLSALYVDYLRRMILEAKAKFHK